MIKKINIKFKFFIFILLINYNFFGQNIDKFIALRTTFLPQDTIPFVAVIHNTTNNIQNYTGELMLPPNVSLVSGTQNLQNHNLSAMSKDSVLWKLQFNQTGNYQLKVIINTTSGFFEKTLNINVIDKFWQQPEFFISAYNPPYCYRPAPYENTDFLFYKNAGFDNFMWVKDDPDLMNKVHQFGFKYLLDIRYFFNEEDANGVDYLRAVKVLNDGTEIYNITPQDITENMLQDLEVLVNQYKDDPDLLGYWVCDEPFPAAYNNLEKVVKRIETIDPERYCLINIGDNEYSTDENIEKFITQTQIKALSYDHYNFFNGYDTNDDYFDLLGRMRKMALTFDIPLYNHIQLVGTNGTSADFLDWRTPSPAEHRWLVYTSLTYGVHGIIWFHWDAEDWGLVQNPDKNLIYPSVTAINTEIDSLKEIMLGLKSTRIYHLDNQTISRQDGNPKINFETNANANLIVGFFKNIYENKNYFMLTNKDFENPLSVDMQTEFLFNDLKVFNTNYNSWENVPVNVLSNRNGFSVDLRAGEGKLYEYTGTAIDEIHTDIQLTNYPNAFENYTIIQYSVPFLENNKIKRQEVKLEIFDMQGKLVLKAFQKKLMPGNYMYKLDFSNMSKGTYICRLQCENYSKSIKILHFK